MAALDHQEFSSPKPEPTRAEIEEQLRERYPLAMAAADEFREAFGDSDNTILLLEQDGRQRKSQFYKPDSDYHGWINAGEWLEMSKRHPPAEDPRNDQERPFEQK
jgi:hypothetical protein